MMNEKTTWNNLFERIDFLCEKLDKIEEKLSSDKPSIQSKSKKELMNVNEVADYLLRSKNSIYKLAERRKIPHSTKNGKLYFDMDEINNWLNSGKRMTEVEITEKTISKLMERQSKRRFFN